MGGIGMQSAIGCCQTGGDVIDDECFGGAAIDALRVKKKNLSLSCKSLISR